MRWLILSVCAFWAAGTATAQQSPATDVEPPRYDGAVVKVYMTRLVAGPGTWPSRSGSRPTRFRRR